MALTSIKVSQLNGSPDKVSNEDIVYVVKALPTGEFISVKSPLSDLSNLFFENVKEDFYSYTIDKSDEERVESDEKYVHKEHDKQLSTLSFEREDKTELYALRPNLMAKIAEEHTYSETTYVAKQTDKQLSTLSFERADHEKLYSLEQFTLDRITEEVLRSDEKYVHNVVGKQLSSLSFEQSDKDKIYGLVNTDNLTEGSVNKYFTAPRAVNSALTGYVVGGNVAVVPEDTVMQAIAKLQAQINVLKGTVVDLQNQINTNHPPANP